MTDMTPHPPRWRRLAALGTISLSSLLVALSALAYRSFVDLPM